MKSGGASRRSIRCSFFIGILVGSIFSGTGAFADIPLDATNFYSEISRSISSYDPDNPAAPKTFTISGEIDMAEALANKVDSDFDGSGDSNFSTGQVVFSGEFRDSLIGSNRATLSNLSNTLFDQISGQVREVILNTSGDGISGRGVLANEVLLSGEVSGAHSSGTLTSNGYGGLGTGGLVGANRGTIEESTSSVNVSSWDNVVGGLVGENSGDIVFSSSSGNVSPTESWYSLEIVGGLAGFSSGEIKNSSASGTVIANGQIGGLVGVLSGILEDSFVTNSTQVGNVSSNTYIGGLVGTAIAGSQIKNSNSEAVTTGYSRVGGLVGGGIVSIENSTSSGIVNGQYYSVGGLVGELQSSGELFGTILNSYSTSTVNGNGAVDVGGLVGASSGAIENSYALGNVSGQGNIGGLVGSTSSNSTVLTSFAAGGVTGYSSGENSGGLVGLNNGQISNSYATGVVQGGDNVGGLVGRSTHDISNTYAHLSEGNISGAGNYIGGLVGKSEADISNSYAVLGGSVFGAKDNVGGLVGRMDGDISNSYSNINGNIYSSGTNLPGDPYGRNVGGLVGFMDGDLNNSFSDTGMDIYGAWTVGGLVGNIDGQISNSGSRTVGDIYTINDGNAVAGLAGAITGQISNSFAIVGGNISGSTYVGGIAGLTYGNIENSHARIIGKISGTDSVGGVTGYIQHSNITNSDATVNANIEGTGYVGALAGRFESDNSKKIEFSNAIIRGLVLRQNMTHNYLVGSINNGLLRNSYFLIDNSSEIEVTSDLRILDLAGSYGGSQATLDYTADYFWSISQSPSLPTLLNVVSTSPSTSWGSSGFCNQGLPHLISLVDFYENNCAEPVIPVEPTPNPDRPKREREIREVKEARTPEKIEKSLGFKNETALPKNALIAFVESNTKIEIANVKAVEIAPTANAKVNAKAGEALQISLKSESKEPIELWVKSPDGSWLLAGVITFDKDGKAILPPLQFKSAGDFTLVLNKQSADSAKGRAPLNQSGSLLVAVS